MFGLFKQNLTAHGGVRRFNCTIKKNYAILNFVNKVNFKCKVEKLIYMISSTLFALFDCISTQFQYMSVCD